MDCGRRTRADVLSELRSALVELVCCLSGEDIGMQNGIEDDWVGGFGLAEVGGQHMGMLLWKENELGTRLWPQVWRRG